MANNILRSDKPPRHLSKEAKRIWRQICGTWELKDAPDALLILRTGLEAFDRLQQARSVLDIDGVVITHTTSAGEQKIMKHRRSRLKSRPVVDSSRPSGCWAWNLMAAV